MTVASRRGGLVCLKAPGPRNHPNAQASAITVRPVTVAPYIKPPPTRPALLVPNPRGELMHVLRLDWCVLHTVLNNEQMAHLLY